MSNNFFSRVFSELKALVSTNLFRITTVLWSGRTAAIAIGLVGNVILARVLGVEGFGRFALLLATATIINNLIDLRMWETVVKFLSQFRSEGDPRKSRAFIKLSYMLSFLSGALSVGVAAVLVGFVSLGFLPYRLQFLVIVFATSVAIQTLNRLSLSVLRVYDSYVVQSAYQITLAALTLVFYVATVIFFGLGLEGAAISHLLASFLSTFVLVFYVVKTIRTHCRGKASISDLGEHFGEIFSFGLHVKLYGFLKLVREFDVIIVKLITNDFSVGIYSIATRIVQLVNIIFEPLFNIIYPEMAKYVHNREFLKLRKLINYITVISPVIVAAMLVVFIVAGEMVLSAALGEGYAPAFLPVVLLLLSYIPQQAVLWGRPLYLSFGLPKAFNLITVGTLVLRLMVMVPATFWLSFNGPPLAYLLSNSALALFMMMKKDAVIRTAVVNEK